MTRKLLIIVLVIAALAAAGFFGWMFFVNRSAPGSAVVPSQNNAGQTGSTSPSEGTVEDVDPATKPPVERVAGETTFSPNEFLRPTLPKQFPEAYPGYDAELSLAGSDEAIALIPKPSSSNASQVPIPDALIDAGGAAPSADGAADPDGDGLTNDQERQQGSNPTKADTDDDGASDSTEVRSARTDPNKADTDGDGLTDGEELNRWKTDPLNPDSDGDRYTDGAEVKGGYNPNGPGKI